MNRRLFHPPTYRPCEQAFARPYVEPLSDAICLREALRRGGDAAGCFSTLCEGKTKPSIA
ncbi:hypothetical protein [Candidatus Nitrospira nitrificans]|uniref:hypothetical protein n=1 Tax=Candidatus Nitrospira nitrificans TaxID=1742973 RepID=UPI001111CFB0|nr:hypothetical protein [Candidatus Nitrospira nitrificans]